MGFIGRKTLEAIQSVTDDEFKNYVGLNAYKFMQVRESLKAGGLGFSFSWAIFLCGPFWAAYRKLWGWFFLYLIAYLFFQLTNNGFFFFVFCLLGGFTMSSNYVQSASKKIAFLKRQEINPERLKAILEKAGGTSKLNACVAVIVWVSIGTIVVGAQGGFDTANFQSRNIFDVATAPDCNSHEGISAVIKTIEESPESKVLAIRAFDIEEISEVAFDAAKDVRSCKGVAMMNSGRTPIRYTFAARLNGEYWVEVNETSLDDVASQTQTYEVLPRRDDKPSLKERDASRGAHPDWELYQGMHPHKVLSSPDVESFLKPILKVDYDALKSFVDVASNTQLIGRFLVGQGCVPHMCPDGAFFAINVDDNTVFFVQRGEGVVEVISGYEEQLPVDVFEVYKNW